MRKGKERKTGKAEEGKTTSENRPDAQQQGTKPWRTEAGTAIFKPHGGMTVSCLAKVSSFVFLNKFDKKENKMKWKKKK